MSLTLYHNPRCSKSREAKRLLDEAGAQYETVLYLKETPREDTLRWLARNVEDAAALVRTREGKAAGWTRTDGATPDEVARFLAKHPEALQRPVLTDARRAIIARPPERVSELL